ncbi:hypothetical protein KJ032_27145, partial [Salmonella enterica subsp. enterica serovar Typhimurium]|nr:hypothetical protein [Salmonella enterica subsp. enterica serovar Typhimurium]
ILEPHSMSPTVSAIVKNNEKNYQKFQIFWRFRVITRETKEKKIKIKPIFSKSEKCNAISEKRSEKTLKTPRILI